MKNKIKKIFFENNFEINDENVNNFHVFYEFLAENNEKFNLTRIISEEDVIKKHFLDSVSSSQFIPENAKVVDVGAGGGFPSIPLKIIRPDINLTMIDSVNKKVDFLNQSVEKLNLTNALALHCRVEDVAHEQNHRETYDVCVSRAVANLSTLAEYCLPLVKVGGMFIAYKGALAEEELKQAKNALSILGAELIKTHIYQIEEDRTNYLLIFKKTRRTPNQYPRRNNKPRKSPL